LISFGMVSFTSHVGETGWASLKLGQIYIYAEMLSVSLSLFV